MRIIADKHDYYDKCISFGVDPTIVYVRKPGEEQLKRWPFPWMLDIDIGLSFTHYVIGFCGKIYPCIRTGTSRYGDQNEIITIEKFCYTEKDIDSFVRANANKKQLAKFYGEDRRVTPIQALLAKFFAECKRQQDAFKAMFEERRSPVFVARQPHIRRWGEFTVEWDVLLKEYEFYRVFDFTRAFQEVFMFMGNLAQPQKPMPVISDEAKVQAHGMDKWSFRRPPGT